jgi:ankyrin repeat protein
MGTRRSTAQPVEGMRQPLHMAADQGRESVAKQLLAARCNVDLQKNDGFTALEVAECYGHAGGAR